jgi:hypothetical protein
MLLNPLFTSVEECLQYFGRLHIKSLHEQDLNVYYTHNLFDEIDSGGGDNEESNDRDDENVSDSNNNDYCSSSITLLPSSHIDVYHRSIKNLLSEFPQLFPTHSGMFTSSSLDDLNSILDPSLKTDIENILQPLLVTRLTVMQLEAVRKLVYKILREYFGRVVEGVKKEGRS